MRSNFLDQISTFKHSISIIEENKCYSYHNLIDKIKFYGKEIDGRGIKTGDSVMLLADYTYESIALFLAMYLKGLIIIPVTSHNQHELEQRLAIIGSCFIYDLRDNKFFLYEKNSTNNYVEKLRESGNSGLILFSSGSTGKPKAMIHNLDNLVASYSGKKKKSLVFIVFLMFDHIGGLNTLLNCLSSGATLVLPSSRDPFEIARLIEEHKVNILPASPTFLNLMLIAKVYENFDFKSLKMITYGTEPMPLSLLKKLKHTFSGVKFLQTFGTSETGIAKTISLSSESTLFKFDDENQEYKIVDGELWLRSKTQIMGYLNHSMDSFTDDGWFKTGDLVAEVEGGYFSIVGRAKEVINVGGEKVLPTEVETIIMELPEVADCIVFGMPNAITGQIVAAEIILSGKDVDINKVKVDIKHHCFERLDKFKVPVKIVIIDKMDISERFKKMRLKQ